jgi:hypothetical protein
VRRILRHDCRQIALLRSTEVTDTELATAILGASGAIVTTIVGFLRWSRGRRSRSQDQSTAALVKSAESSALLAARIDSLDRGEASKKNLDAAVAKLDTAATRLDAVTGRLESTSSHNQALSVRIERAIEILERLPRLDKAQLAQLAKVRGKIAHGRGPSQDTPRSADTPPGPPGRSGED